MNKDKSLTREWMQSTEPGHAWSGMKSFLAGIWQNVRVAAVFAETEIRDSTTLLHTPLSIYWLKEVML